MKQPDVVSPITFVWDRYLTLTNVTFEQPKSKGSRDMNFYLVNLQLMSQTDRQADRQMEGDA